MKKAIMVLLLLSVLLVGTLLVLVPEKKVQNARTDIVVTTFALYDIARHLLGPDGTVAMLLPFGRDVHTFEPTPQDMIRVEQSRLFLYSGAGLEPWSTPFRARDNAVDMSRFVTLHESGEEAHHHDTDDTAHHAHPIDPHYWLDIDNMIGLVQGMEGLFRKAFASMDEKELHARAEAYIARLKTLDGLFKKRLASCRLDTIVVSHNAFGYLAERYGFHVAALTGLSPDTMPDAKTMAALSDFVREKGVKTLFYESFVSDKLAASLARESGVRVDVLQPLANITDKEVGADYFRLMNANLLKLHDALECR